MTLRKSSIADRVYETVKDDIFEFRLLPGDKFSEGDVGERLDTSRTPVRQALFRLQREGYVDVLFRSGWQVKPLDFQKIAELYDLRISLEQATVYKLGALPEKPLVLRTLRDIWNPASRAERAVGSTVRALDESFHSDLVAAAGNQEMSRIHREITERLRVIRRLDFTREDRIDATYREHAAILTALEENDPALAAKRLAKHIHSSHAAVQEITIERLREAAEEQRQLISSA